MEDYRILSDEKLADLLSKDNDLAFTEIFNRYNSVLYVFAYKKVKAEEEARDIVQDIFITLWNRRTELNLHSSLSAYLFKAVSNRALNLFIHRKYEKAYVESFDQYLLEYDSSPEHLLKQKELKSIIEREINRLPPKMREVFELSRYSHLSHREIAEKLSISELTVKTHVKKALRILRLRLGFFVYLLYLLFLSNS